MEEGEENVTDSSMSEKEAGVSNHDESTDCNTSNSLHSEEATVHGSPDPPEGPEVKQSKENEEEPALWMMPESLELNHLESQMQVRACQTLSEGFSWGPYEGSINSSNKSTTELEKPSATVLLLELKDERCWLRKFPITMNEELANCTIYCEGDQIWCKTTKPIAEGENLTAIVVTPDQTSKSPKSNHSVKMELVEPAEISDPSAMYPATLHSDIQLLPQQAGMAAILATAVVNKDIFPCKSCGIWYRSERNLQAHLMYYCASRQKPSSVPTEEKPKEPSPHERICPFPQCNKSCPSASSLEIHMRSHSGERPFVCLICLSAFTTKANCERHLKVHTDSLNGVCQGCGFVATTRDILYTHLVTNHMACQPGSKSDLYSPATGLSVPPLSGLKVADPSASLKCSQCEFVGDSESSLQQHSSLHLLQGAFQCSQCHKQLRSETELAKHIEGHQALESQHGTEEAKGTDERGTPASRKEVPEEANRAVKIKEEPQRGVNSQSESESEKTLEGQANPTTDHSSSASSPRSTPVVKVKSERSSPTPASSPVHYGAASVMPEGTVLIPYMFNHETSTFPQASEILAKMSELVHSRLKQGVNNYPLLYAGAPIQKGATCYECDITFNNVNNYLVHKRLYCSSRHQQPDNAAAEPPKQPAPPSVTDQESPSPAPAVENQVASSSQTDPEADPQTANVDVKPPEIKTEENVTKDTSSEGDSLSRVSEGSQSPSNSLDDLEDDPNRTVCEACNIRFTRHETYVVHKRFYCASRHDPPLRRPNSGKVPFLQQNVRTRKRRKLYEIHSAGHQPLPPPPANEVSVHSPSAAVLQCSGLPNNAEALKIKQESLPLSSKSTDALSVSTGYMLTRSSATSSPGSSSDVDGPIDLSKKSRIQEEPSVHAPPLVQAPNILTDYHECTSCKISFNNVENYLAHKKYYCPATALQHSNVEHLVKAKIQATISVKPRKSNRMDVADPPMQSEELNKKNVNAKCVPESPHLAHPYITPNNSPGVYHYSADVLQDRPQLSPHIKSSPAPQRTPVVCPYCPLNGPIEGDLIEHFKHVHGLLLTKQTVTGHTAESNTMDTSSQGKHQTNNISESSPHNSRIPASSLQPGTQIQKNILNAKDQRESVSSQSSSESPVENISPKPILTASPKVVKISPVPDVPTDPGSKSPIPPINVDKSPISPINVDKSVQTAMSLPSPVQNGNHRFCRLCNIKFSSLSTFIAHKKYYCSSHTSEHVK
eukprot:gi/632944498/ref/XP_007887542.1/ PREDICTED: zinc finger protein ZFPM1 isoform X2 [Callorhinchus milii]